MNEYNHDDRPITRFYRYRIHFTAPVNVKSTVVSHRPGILVQWKTSDHVGWGDIAPLDGFSPDTYQSVEAAIRNVIHNPSLLDETCRTFPSVRCGMQFAQTSFPPSGNLSLPVARLITGSTTDAMLEDVQHAVDSGYTTIKIKVGARPVIDDIELMRQVQHTIPPGVNIRLDANQRWDLTDAVMFATSIPPESVEYIEEPLMKWDDYGHYDSSQGLPFAVDESLAGKTPGQLDSWKNLRALVLKPMILGGPGITREWMDWAETNGLSCTISSVFESGVGMRSLLSLAASRSKVTALGVDTYSRLADDVVSPRLEFARGRINLDQLQPGHWNVRMDQLEEIT
jgi:o-succinylbenzoate synthase